MRGRVQNRNPWFICAALWSAAAISVGCGDDEGEQVATTIADSTTSAQSTSESTLDDELSSQRATESSYESTSIASSTLRWPPYGVATDVYADGIDVPECASRGGPGPWEVGVVTIEVDDVEAEVWYPAAPEGARPDGRDFYDMRDWLPRDDRDKISDDDIPLFVTAAWRDVDPAAEGPFPLVLFSHGLAGYRFQSSALTVHLASWGMVVASRDHAGRTLQTILGDGPDESGFSDDLGSLRDRVLALSEESDHVLAGLVDGSFVAATGHSAGAGSVAATVNAGGVDAAIYYAGSGGPEEPSSIPELSMAGTRDSIISSSQSRSSWEALGVPATWLAIEDAGHLAFSDICLIGEEQGGLLEIAADNGVRVPGFIRGLGSDGCRNADLDPRIAWPIIHHVSTQFLLQAAGLEESAVDPDEVNTCFGDLIAEVEVR